MSVWDLVFDDDDDIDVDYFKDCKSLKLGFECIAAGAFDELGLAPLLDDAAEQSVSPVVKAFCMEILSDPHYAFYKLAERIELLPYKVLLGPEVRLANLRHRAVYKVFDQLGSMDLETLYRQCAQRALQLVKSAESSEDAQRKNVIFFASGLVRLIGCLSNGHSSYLGFNALLDGKSKIPAEICFAEIPEEDALAHTGSKAKTERRRALISLLEHTELQGSVLELGKAMQSKGLLDAAQKSGIEVVLRQADAPLVEKPIRWTLWEFLQHECLDCGPQTLKTPERARAVCFILAVSLLLWYFLRARLEEVCSRLGVYDLLEEPVKKTGKKKGAASQFKPISMEMFYRQVNRLLQPELLFFPERGEFEFDCVGETLAAVVKELGPCYQRFLTPETYNFEDLKEQLELMD